MSISPDAPGVAEHVRAVLAKFDGDHAEGDGKVPTEVIVLEDSDPLNPEAPMTVVQTWKQGDPLPWPEQ